jgi:hypothetical protein
MDDAESTEIVAVAVVANAKRPVERDPGLPAANGSNREGG